MALSIEVRASRQSKLGEMRVVRVGASDGGGLVVLLIQSVRSFGFAIDGQGRISIGCAPLREADRLAASTTNDIENRAERITPSRPGLQVENLARLACRRQIVKAMQNGIAGIPKRPLSTI